MKTSAIEVHDMLSVFSVDEVETRIGEVLGVQSVTVNFAVGNATVRYDETQLDAIDIKSAVRQRGFDPAASAGGAAGYGDEGKAASGAPPKTTPGSPPAGAAPVPPDTQATSAASASSPDKPPASTPPEPSPAKPPAASATPDGDTKQETVKPNEE